MLKLLNVLVRIANALEKQAIAQERIALALEDQQLPEKGDQKAAAAVLGVSARTVARHHEDWIEGIHFYRKGRRVIYNLALIRDWQVNQEDPKAHQRAIEKWRNTLPSAQPKRSA